MGACGAQRAGGGARGQQTHEEAALLLWVTVDSLGRLMRRRAVPWLRGLGLRSPLEFFVCRKLTQEGPQRLTDLARALHLPASTLSEMTDRLVADGMLRRAPHPADRRSVVLAPTAKTEALETGLREAVTRGFAEILGRLAPADLATVTDGLRVMARALEQAAEPGGPGQPCRDHEGR